MASYACLARIANRGPGHAPDCRRPELGRSAFRIAAAELPAAAPASGTPEEPQRRTPPTFPFRMCEIY